MDVATLMDQNISWNDELYHYGVKGMKWGHRKNPEVESARSAYKSAKKDYKSAQKALKKGYAGINGLSRFRKNESKVNKSELKMIDAKAKYKASKAKNSDKARKAEFKTYAKEMKKSGLVGSSTDRANNRRSERIYNHLKIQKGKAYADKVQKKVNDTLITEFAVEAAAAVGLSFVSAYLNAEYINK